MSNVDIYQSELDEATDEQLQKLLQEERLASSRPNYPYVKIRIDNVNLILKELAHRAYKGRSCACA